MTEDEMRSKEYSLCFIDGDLLVYQAAASAQKRWYAWEHNNTTLETFDSAKACKEYQTDAEEFMMEDTSQWIRKDWLVIGEREDAFKALDNAIDNIKKNVKARRYDIYVAGEGNFRDNIAKAKKYKGGRENIEKPVHLKAVKEYIVSHWGAKQVNGIEVDDIGSIIQFKGYCHNPKNPATVHVSVDKDAKGTPGVLYNPTNNEFLYRDEYNANLWLFKQSLMGDSVDAIGGLPQLAPELQEKYSAGKRKGVGEKTAEAILGGCEGIQEMYQRVLECYQAHYGDSYEFVDWQGNPVVCSAEDMMDEQMNLLFMLRRKGEYWSDFKRHIKESL